MFTYPSLTDCITATKILSASLTKGNLFSAEDRAANANAAWTVQGYAQGMFIGDPSPLMAAQPTYATDAELLSAVEAACHKQSQGLMQAGGIWLALALQVAELIIKLLNK